MALFSIAAFLGALALAPGLWRLVSLPATVHPNTGTRHSHVEPAPLCPWREPERDRREFFPGATGVREELRILSHLRVALVRDLGRPLTSEEMLLRPFRVVRGAQTVGTVLVRRVKGEFGAIELVLAVSSDGRVRGLRLQRQREPDAIAAALTAPDWLTAYRGKTADSPLRVGKDLPAVRPEARISAAAVAEGVRSLLIVLRAAETRGRDGGAA